MKTSIVFAIPALEQNRSMCVVRCAAPRYEDHETSCLRPRRPASEAHFRSARRCADGNAVPPKPCLREAGSLFWGRGFTESMQCLCSSRVCRSALAVRCE